MTHPVDVTRSPTIQPPRSGLPPPPPLPPPAPPEAPRRRRWLRATLLILAAVLVGVAGAVWLTRADRAGHTITKAQWASVPIGSSRQQTIDRLGKDPYRTPRKKGESQLEYLAADGDFATFHFQAKSGKLWFKSWLVTVDENSAITPAAARAIKEGMTLKQVETRLGAPRGREFEVYRFYGSSLERFGKTARQCLFYSRTPKRDTLAMFCFIDGKLVKKA